ncbi:MAG: GntR family transcriptional regulator [Evtepia sp.]|nr:GntR family transcriptional regulator [Evtepia sp.]
MIQLNYRDSRPIYEQVRDGLRQLLMSGAILPGEKLPSVRALASSLTINPNTIQRAYEALENEGYVYTQIGKGTFAAELSDVNLERRQELLVQFDQTASELLFLGTPAETLIQRLREMEEKRND